MKKKMKSLGDRLSDAKKAAHNAFSNQEIRLLLEKYGYDGVRGQTGIYRSFANCLHQASWN